MIFRRPSTWRPMQYSRTADCTGDIPYRVISTARTSARKALLTML
ncbi:hypothetical protein [Streptomyces caniscabiei]|nr:hypothetical protein [Streptomyces caniscabiei]